jgi:hypothetical protein
MRIGFYIKIFFLLCTIRIANLVSGLILFFMSIDTWEKFENRVDKFVDNNLPIECKEI